MACREKAALGLERRSMGLVLQKSCFILSNKNIGFLSSPSDRSDLEHRATQLKQAGPLLPRFLFNALNDSFSSQALPARNLGCRQKPTQEQNEESTKLTHITKNNDNSELGLPSNRTPRPAWTVFKASERDSRLEGALTRCYTTPFAGKRSNRPADWP